jgi:hypothetical protein
MTRNPALLAGLAHADKLQKPDAVQGHCSDDGDVYFPPNDAPPLPAALDDRGEQQRLFHSSATRARERARLISLGEVGSEYR